MANALEMQFYAIEIEEKNTNGTHQCVPACSPCICIILLCNTNTTSFHSEIYLYLCSNEIHSILPNFFILFSHTLCVRIGDKIQAIN